MGNLLFPYSHMFSPAKKSNFSLYYACFYNVEVFRKTLVLLFSNPFTPSLTNQLVIKDSNQTSDVTVLGKLPSQTHLG